MEVIAAIATAQRVSAVGIVRLSGEGSRAIAAKLFTPQSGRDAAALSARVMTYGALRDEKGRLLDHALLVLFDAGSSYTGEESAEFHCHGSPVVLGAVLTACFACGARAARAGEFTKRAFLNGRLDLTEAEAVIDLIDAETEECARNAAAQLGGALSRCVEEVRESLLDIESRFYAVVDYPDEDIEDLTRAEMEQKLAAAEAGLTRLLGTYGRGRFLKSGVPTAIIGAPNAGKSSLLNALLGYDRAIVTDLPGTTRDTVEETCVLGGVPLRLSDTAGIRETSDAVEKLGVARAKQALARAELVLALADGSRKLTDEDAAILRLVQQSGKPWIFVQTKKDLAKDAVSLGIVGKNAPQSVALSAVTGEGIDALERAVAALFPAGEAPAGTLLTNARQAQAVERALASVRAAKDALRAGMTPDVVLTEAEEAGRALDELTGRSARADIVERIFERFCVGK